jgi:rSAM/selenodomain-associated transferase 1
MPRDLVEGEDLMPRETLILFTRYPEPGRTKTRLIPALGRDGAADLSRRMTEDALREARLLAARRNTTLKIYYEGGDVAQMAEWLGDDLIFVKQAEGDLGQRMARAFSENCGTEDGSAVIMGTDCPDLSAAILWRAFDLLLRNDLVLGPADDGGYYLIGLRSACDELFQDMPWSTDEVFSRTIGRATTLGLSFTRLETLRDIDRPEDLRRWNQFQRTGNHRG